MEQPRQGERAARNQSLFREINEEVASLNQMLDELTPYGSWGASVPASIVSSGSR